MEESRRSFQTSGGGDFKTEVVSGKSHGNGKNHMYGKKRSRSPDLWSVPPRRRDATAKSVPWSFNDSEMKRRKRIAQYKVYSIEGRVKASLRKGLKWISSKCSEIIHGY